MQLSIESYVANIKNSIICLENVGDIVKQTSQLLNHTNITYDVLERKNVSLIYTLSLLLLYTIIM